MKFSRIPLVFLVIELVLLSGPRWARADWVLVEFRGANGATLVSSGDLDDNTVLMDEEETRKRVEARARAIAQARAALLRSLDPDVVAAVFDDYRHFPLLRADVDGEQRRALEGHPQVVVVHEDRQRQILTDSSLAYLGSSIWHDDGHIGDGTAVAVLDSGIRYWNGFFGECPEPGAEGCRVAVFEGFAHLSWGSGSTDPREVAEYSGHGSNVGGIVGDMAPGTQLLSLGVFAYYEPDPSSGFQGDVLANDGDVAAALDWVIEHRDEYNIVSANMSLGSTVDPNARGYCTGVTAGAYVAVFANTRDAGVLPVVASGNDYSKTAVSSPACVPSAVTVGASYDDPAYGFTCGTGPVVPGSVTCFSNSNVLVDLVGPGNDIDAGGLYGLGGTSMAAPHVAGLVALYQARYLTSPVWTIERMRADAVVVEEIGPEQLYLHRSIRIGDHSAALAFDSGVVLESDFNGLSIPDGNDIPVIVVGDVVCESELCASGVVGHVYLDLQVEHFGTGDLVIELEAPDGTVARHEVVDDTELGMEHVNSILGSQHLEGVFDGLAGAPVEGRWTVRLSDDEAGREGSLFRAVVLIDSARVELRGDLEAPAIVRPDEPFEVSVTLENAGNLDIDGATLAVELVTVEGDDVVDSVPLELELPSTPGTTTEYIVALEGPQGGYEIRLVGVLDPDLAPGLVTESRLIDVTYRTFASFVVEPEVPLLGEVAQLRVISRGMVEGARWEFGDGETAAAVSPSHQWVEAGEYEVRLTVDGPDGSSTTARMVTVRGTSEPIPPSSRMLNVGGGGCSCQTTVAFGSRVGGLVPLLLALLVLAALRRRRFSGALALAVALSGASACWDGDQLPLADGGPGDADVEVMPPEIGPWVSLLDPVSPTIGDVPVFVMLSSDDSSSCDLSLDVRIGAGEWTPATIDDQGSTAGLPSAPEGVEHVVTWIATIDIPGDVDDVQLRAVAVCDDLETLPVETSAFRVLNYFENNPHAVLITEVSTADDNVPAANNADYVELYNTTDEAISLDGWVLIAGSAGGGQQEFSLDESELLAGQRLIIIEAGGSITGALELDDELRWTVETNGWVAVLASENRGVDFVRWGGSPATPPVELGWSDDPPLSIPQTLTVLARGDEENDTDRASDFCVALPSPAEANDRCIVEYEPSDMLITELDSQGMFDQVEVLNNSGDMVDLGGWVLLWDGDDLGSGHVPLAGVEIADGDRIALRDNGTAGAFHDGILELGENLNIDGLVPIALALQDPHGRVIDFLAGGGSPIRWVDWEELEPTPMPGPRTTLSRRPGDPDTDSAADFCLTEDNLLEGASECLEPLEVDLVISEVMPGRPDWIEVFNPGPDPVDLGQVYVSYTAPYYGGSVGDYRLSGTLEPLDFVILSERPLDTVPDALTTGGENIALAPEGDGTVALRDLHGFGIDFVMWGEPAGRPLWPDVWLGLGFATHGEDDYISLQRFPHDGEDTDSGDGWCWAYPSPGGPNASCERE